MIIYLSSEAICCQYDSSQMYAHRRDDEDKIYNVAFACKKLWSLTKHQDDERYGDENERINKNESNTLGLENWFLSECFMYAIKKG